MKSTKMNTLLTTWLLASTALASPHLEARGEKYCPDTTGEVMCPPFNSCGTGTDLGSCCPFEGGPCTTYPPSPHSSSSEVPPSTTGSGSTSVTSSSTPSPSAYPPYSDPTEEPAPV